MKPKSRKEILDICQNNFWNYSTLSKIMIIISIVLSAGAVAYYIGGYIIPLLQGIINNEIVGWDVVWKISLGYILYYVLQFANLIFISIGGAAVCREENWETIDFATAWVDLYKYDKYINDSTDDKSESEE